MVLVGEGRHHISEIVCLLALRPQEDLHVLHLLLVDDFNIFLPQCDRIRTPKRTLCCLPKLPRMTMVPTMMFLLDRHLHDHPMHPGGVESGLEGEEPGLRLLALDAFMTMLAQCDRSRRTLQRTLRVPLKLQWMRVVIPKTMCLRGQHSHGHRCAHQPDHHLLDPEWVECAHHRGEEVPVVLAEAFVTILDQIVRWWMTLHRTPRVSLKFQ